MNLPGSCILINPPIDTTKQKNKTIQTIYLERFSMKNLRHANFKDWNLNIYICSYTFRFVSAATVTAFRRLTEQPMERDVADLLRREEPPKERDVADFLQRGDAPLEPLPFSRAETPRWRDSPLNRLSRWENTNINEKGENENTGLVTPKPCLSPIVFRHVHAKGRAFASLIKGCPFLKSLFFFIFNPPLS